MSITPKTVVKGLLVLVIIFLLPFVMMQVRYRVFNNRTVEPKVAIVFGAGLTPDNKPTKVLAARLNEAITLYNLGKINKILVSGDNREVSHNEPQAMTDYLIKLGINKEDIVQDYAGTRTVNTCYRAKNVFYVQSAYIISQPFHLPRALWLCESYGINVKTVGATNLPFWPTVYQYIREIPSSLIAFLQAIHYDQSMPQDGSETTIGE
jgi:SanA protein